MDGMRSWVEKFTRQVLIKGAKEKIDFDRISKTSR
jgi:hypothetical protein